MGEVQPARSPYDESQAPVGDENEPRESNGVPTPPASIEKWSRTTLPRGRQARDPLAESVQYKCSTLESMKDLLRHYLASPTGPAEHTTIEFTFPTSSAFMVSTAFFLGLREAQKARANLFASLSRTALSVVDALSQTDPKEQMRKQKSIAKAIVESIQEVDGYRYSFHNNWLSKEDEAWRFSFYCNDSTLNKGRAANEGAGTEGKKKVKPVYDCQGLLWIKFSVTKQNLEVHYKHTPLHKTYDERAPPPRKDSKRRKLLELFEPEKLPQPGVRKRKSKADQPENGSKRRATEPPRIPEAGPVGESGRDDSLAPLVDFLHSADREGGRTMGHGTESAEPQTSSEPPVFPPDKPQQLKDTSRTTKPPKEPKPPRPRKPELPGMMSGYMAGDLITWGEKERRGSRGKAAQQPAPSSEPLAGIVAAAAGEVGPSAPSQPPAQMSELDMLKAKLAAAEAKIHNLEAEKSRPFGPPGWPPSGPPPSAQYNYPPPPSYRHYPSPQYHQPIAPSPPAQAGASQSPGNDPTHHTIPYGAPPPTATQRTAASAVGVKSSAKGNSKKARSSGASVNGPMA